MKIQVWLQRSMTLWGQLAAKPQLRMGTEHVKCNCIDGQMVNGCSMSQRTTLFLWSLITEWMSWYTKLLKGKRQPSLSLPLQNNLSGVMVVYTPINMNLDRKTYTTPTHQRCCVYTFKKKRKEEKKRNFPYNSYNIEECHFFVVTFSFFPVLPSFIEKVKKQKKSNVEIKAN